MPRKEGQAVPEGNGPVPQQQKFGSGQPTLENFCRIMSEEIDKIFDKHIGIIRELYEDMSVIDQRVASLEQDTRHPRLTMEADGQADTKTRERTEGAATAVQATHDDSCSANRVDSKPMCSTSFGDDSTRPPVLPCSREDALVNNGAAAPKSRLSRLEMRTTTAAGAVTSHRRNLYSNKDHLRLLNSFVMSD